MEFSKRHTETLDNGNVIHYKEFEGVCYHEQTSEDVVRVLANARADDTRIRVCFGDVETGRDWKEEFGVVGYVGRSTGRIKIPLLVFNKQSMGGGGLLYHCIVKIVTARGGRVLYQHPKYYIEN